MENALFFPANFQLNETNQRIKFSFIDPDDAMDDDGD